MTKEFTIKCPSCNRIIRSDSKRCIFCERPIDLFNENKERITVLKEE